MKLFLTNTLFKTGLLFAAMFMGANTLVAQVATNGGSGLALTYPDLAAAITALNGATITSSVVITRTGNETAPAGGYSITAQGTLANTITIQGSGSTITASAAHTVGALNDAIFKLVGADYVTLQNFTMQENALNGTTPATLTTAGTNNMTEWGVALLYATTANGAQNNTIQNCTISLNRLCQNTFGIYANATHSATAISTSASATTATGGNSGLKVYSNSISNVNNGIVVVGPLAAADFNNGIDIGGTSAATANTITNFGTTGTFSGYFSVSGTVNGILVRNSTTVNISYNTITSSVGGVTVGTLNGIQVPAATVAPTNTFTNTINNNSISLKSGLATGAMIGISYPAGSASATSTLNINNNDFNNWGHTVVASGALTFITTASTNQFTTINNNTFTNLNVNTTGSVTFISQTFSAIATGTKSVNGNSIVTGFTKTGVGGTVLLVTDNGSSVTGAVSNCQNNNFSNVTLTGATTLTGINYTDGGTAATRTVTNNVLNNWTTGAATINAMNFTYWNGASTLNTNTITNITGQGAITAISIGNTVATATSIGIYNNTINTLVSTGTGGAVRGISCSNTSPNISIYGHTIYNLSSTGAAAVEGILVSGANAAGTSVYNNNIYNLSGSNASTTTNGITVSAGTLVNVYNNLISDLRAPAATSNVAITGINITGGTTVNARYNTIALGQTAALAVGATGVFYSSTTATEISNNIININATTAVATGLVAGIRRSAIGTANVAPATSNLSAASNNNILYVNPAAQNFLYVEGGVFNAIGGINNGYAFSGITPNATYNLVNDGVFNTSCSLFKTFMATNTGGTRNNATFTENNLSATTPPTAGGFAPSGTSFAENGAQTIAAITTDFSATSRTPTNDIGALQFAGTLNDAASPVIAYTASLTGNVFCASGVTATITDASGVNTTAGTAPRLYFKKSTDATAFGAYPTDNAAAFNGWKYVEATGTTSPFTFAFDFALLQTPLANGDIINYFVTAQDNAATANVGSASATFTGGCPVSVNFANTLSATATNSFTYATPPTAITIAGTGLPICVSGTSTLSLSATPALAGVTYQWEESADGVAGWSNATGTSTNATYTTPVLTAIKYYRARVYCGGTEMMASPSPVLAVNVNSPNVGTPTATAICGNGTTTLSTTGSTGTVSWYAAAAGGTALASLTQPVTAATTFYVESQVLGTMITGVAKSVPTGVASTNLTNYGVQFNATAPFILNSVNVYSAAGGTQTIELRNSTGTVLQSINAVIPAGSVSTPTTVLLNFTVPVGTGHYLVTNGASVSMVRESSGAVPPHAIGNVGSATAGWASGSPSVATYYFFYGWNVTPVCATPRTAVVVPYTPAPAIGTLTGPVGTVCGGYSGTLTLSGTDPSYTSFAWSAGATGTTNTATIAPAVNTTYTVTASGGICAATASYSVTTQPGMVATATAAPATVCSGANTQLTSTGVQAFTTPLVSAYTFAAGTGTTLDPMTGATSVIATGNDDTPTAAIALPFTFNYNGSDYTHYGVSPDGWVVFGGAALAPVSEYTNATTSTANTPKLYPYWDDMATGTDGNVKTLVTGTAPNRIFKVQWFTTIPRNTTGAANSTMQAWLYETTNKVEFRYGTMGTPNSGTISSGLTGSATNYNSVTYTSNTASNAAANDVNTIAPALGTIYTFTPVNPTAYTYAWAEGPASPTTLASTNIYNPMANAITVNKTYTVIVTGAGGCTGSASVLVTAGAALSAVPTATPTTICAGQSTVLNAGVVGGGGPFTYTWDNGAAATVNPTVSPAATTTYYVTVADACGISAISSVTITVNAVPVLSITPSVSVICGTGSSVLTASGGVSYAWAANATLSATNIAAPTATPTSSTTYTVTATNAANCTATATYVLNFAPAITVTATADPAAICAGLATDLIGSASPVLAAYCASTHASGCLGDDITNVTLGTIINPSTGCGGTAHYTYFNGGGAQTTELVTGVSNSLTVSFGTDGSQYFGAWIDYNQDGVLAAAEFLGASANAGASGTIAISFTVPPTALNGKTRLRIVGGNDSPVTATQACGTSSSAYGETQDFDVTITEATDAFTYTWSGGLVDGERTSTPTLTASTSYTVTATAPSGCTATNTVAVTVNTTPLTTTNITNTCPVATVNLNTGVTSSTAGLTLQFYTAADLATEITGTGITAAATGTTYYVKATNTTTTCTATASFMATTTTCCVNPVITSAVTNVACFGGATGSITINQTGGDAITTYAWTGSASTTATATGLAAGMYAVTVTAGVGCTASLNMISVGQPSAALTLTQTSTDNTACTTPNGTATFTAAGGTGAYTYTTTAGIAFMVDHMTKTAAHPEFGVGSGNGYTIDGVEGKELTLVRGVTYTFDATMVAGSHPFYITDDANGGGGGAGTQYTTPASAAMITFTPTAAMPNLLYYQCANHSNMGWKINLVTPTSASMLTGLSAGDYTTVVTDANGCMATATATVADAPASFTPTLGKSGNLSCGTTSVTLTATGGTMYNFGAGFGAMATFAVTTPNTYMVTVQNASGCTATASIAVTSNTTVPSANVMGSLAFCTGGSTTLLASPGFTSYVWSGGTAGATANKRIFTTAGTFSVVITGVNGCVTTKTFTTVINSKPVLSSASIPTVCAGSTLTGSVTVVSPITATTTWTSAGGVVATGTTLNIPTATTAMSGLYVIRSTNTCGTTSVGTNAVVKATLPLTVSINNANVLGGNTGSITVTAPTGCTFSWSGSAVMTGLRTGLAAGSYVVTVTPPVGSPYCAVTRTIVVN